MTVATSARGGPTPRTPERRSASSARQARTSATTTAALAANRGIHSHTMSVAAATPAGASTARMAGVPATAPATLAVPIASSPRMSRSESGVCRAMRRNTSPPTAAWATFASANASETGDGAFVA